MPSKRPLVLFTTTLLIVFAFLAAVPLRAADKEKVLLSFGGSNGADPQGNLIFDGAGNLYGTTFYGGDKMCSYGEGCGTVIELTPNGDGKWSEKVLYNFGGGGYGPYAGLIFDAAGNLYGTTLEGGDYDGGTVFELSPDGNGKWTEKVLHSFGSGNDGANPSAGLIFDAAGNLYGTTAGNVFELVPRPDGTWKEKVLHSFPANGEDGLYPSGGVILDAAGNLYGMTCCGGPYGSGCSPNDFGCGTVFELTPQKNGKWTEKLLHSFNHNGKDGYNPGGGLIFDPAGNLYGTAQWGGAHPTGCAIVDGCGIVFELSPTTHGKWKEKVLHSFIDNGKDGAMPDASLIFDPAGNLYGTTVFGGAYDSNCNCGGMVFKLTPETNGKWTEKVLHSFGSGNDGEYPAASLVIDAAGNLYGDTTVGGYFGDQCGFDGEVGECGIVFEIKP